MPHSLRVSAYAVLVDEGRILLCRLAPYVPASPAWTLPGGGIDPGEHPRDAAIREVYEECGLHISVSDEATIDSENFEKDDGSLQALRIIFRGKVLGGELTHEVDGSTDRCEWFTQEETESLPLVEVARLGIRLAFGDLDQGDPGL
ncbi:MAG TPA: NUDIX domain-containing protein [Fimbriimonadaceae bacterium]|nr:NUDIX domain-containing protein [Fimbriimonadaceae bacterium]